MQLELNEEERRDLSSALRTRLRSLHNELAHTDDRHYRQTLRGVLDRLEGIAGRLGEEREQAGPEAVDLAHDARGTTRPG